VTDDDKVDLLVGEFLRATKGRPLDEIVTAFGFAVRRGRSASNRRDIGSWSKGPDSEIVARAKLFNPRIRPPQKFPDTQRNVSKF
jgi:hypothetical protein